MGRPSRSVQVSSFPPNFKVPRLKSSEQLCFTKKDIPKIMSSSECPTTKVSSVVTCRIFSTAFSNPKNSSLSPFAMVPKASYGSMESLVALSNLLKVALEIKFVVQPVSISIWTGTRPTLPGRNHVDRWGLSNNLISMGSDFFVVSISSCGGPLAGFLVLPLLGLEDGGGACLSTSSSLSPSSSSPISI